MPCRTGMELDGFWHISKPLTVEDHACQMGRLLVKHDLYKDLSEPCKKWIDEHQLKDEKEGKKWEHPPQVYYDLLYKCDYCGIAPFNDMKPVIYNIFENIPDNATYEQTKDLKPKKICQSCYDLRKHHE